MPRVHYETPETEHGVDTYEPDDVHAESGPWATLLWYTGHAPSRGLERKIKIPLTRVVRVEE